MIFSLLIFFAISCTATCSVSNATFIFSAIINMATSAAPNKFFKYGVCPVKLKTSDCVLLLCMGAVTSPSIFLSFKACAATVKLLTAYLPPISFKIPGLTFTSSSQQLYRFSCLKLIRPRSLMMVKFMLKSDKFFL